MNEYLFPMYGLEVSHAKTSLLREWVRERDFEEPSLDSFMSLLDCLAQDAPELLLSKTSQACSVPTGEEISPPSSGRWRSSGILSDGELLTADTSASPNLATESTLLGVIETGEVPEEYFLSPNAAKGILRRADRMGRPLFPPLRQSLNILAEKEQ